MLLLLFAGGGDLSGPITTPPVAGSGIVTQFPATSGAWRFSLEIAEPPGSTWYDISQFYVGDRHQFGADEYKGKARSRLVSVQLQIDNVQAAALGVSPDILAPWGQDTTDLFGEDVELGEGLLIRASMVREVASVVVEWLPLWTGRVELWGDASFARGQVRTHVVSVVDTIADLANVPVYISAEAIGGGTGTTWNDWIEDFLLPQASWQFGLDIYGDTGSPDLPVDEAMQLSANTRMDAACDPLGLVWRSRRNGRLVVHPAPWDTTHANRYDNPLLVVYPDGLKFSYTPDFTDIEYIADDDQQPFGIERSVAGILNSFVVTMPDTPDPLVYAVDDPISTDKKGVRPFTATWILNNPPVVDDLLADRAFASFQALPLRTTVDHEGFWTALAIVDHLDPVTVVHATSDDGLVVTGTGWVRNIVEERTVRMDGTLNWQSTVQIDIDSTGTSEALLPVEDLTVSAISYDSALGSWTNPTQPSITPTEVQIRLMGRSLIWYPKAYPGVGGDLAAIYNLTPGTTYTLQVRLVRRVDGEVTNFSVWRQYRFTTLVPAAPIPVPDGTDTDAEIPEEDPDCDLEVDLQENDGTGWTTVDTFTGAELTDNGNGTFSLTTPIPNSFFNDGSMYRFRSSCDGVDWIAGPEFDPPDDWTDPCPTPSALAAAPYDDAIVYVPKICTGAEDGDPDFVFNGMQIIEAVSGIVGVPGDALDEIQTGLADPDEHVLLAIADPDWSDTATILAYGECPQIVGVTGDKSISCRVKVADDVTCVLFECAALELRCVGVSGQWRPSVKIYKPGVTITLTGAALLDLDTVYTITATFDLELGDLKLYVDGVLDNSIGGTDGEPTINALPIWRVGAPPESWITDCALWDRVLVPGEIPTDFELPAAIMALGPAGYWPFDETSGTTANDLSGNARHGTYSGVTVAGQAGSDGGSYAVWDADADEMAVADNDAWSINTASSLTIGVLFRLTNIGNGLLAYKKTHPNDEWAFTVASNLLQAEAFTPTNSSMRAGGTALSPTIAVNEWHLAIAVWSGMPVTSSSPVIVYLDDQTPGMSYAGPGGTLVNGTAQLKWGRDDDAGVALRGALAHAFIIPRAITGPELASIIAAAQADGWI